MNKKINVLEHGRKRQHLSGSLFIMKIIKVNNVSCPSYFFCVWQRDVTPIWDKLSLTLPIVFALLVC